MLTPEEIKKKLEKVFGKRQATVLAEILADAYGELSRAGDFAGVKAALERLAEAQARAEERLSGVEERMSRLELAVERLAEAQARAEERLSGVEERVSRLELAVERLDRAVERLAEAQARAEERLSGVEERTSRLEMAVERLDGAVERLAEAQARTERAVQELAQAVGRLSDTVGYGLEDIARVILPGYLERHFGIRVEELERRFVGPEGQEVEVNLYGEGQEDGQPVVVLGEAKSRIYGRDVEEFVRVIGPVAEGIREKVVKVMVGYLIHPSASRLAQQQGVLLVASYQR